MRALEGIVYSTYSGIALRPRRHAVRDLALARGRRPPVDHHARDRDRDPGPHVRRAVLRARARMAAPRRARPACSSRTARRSTSASRRSRSTRRRSPPLSTRLGEERLRADVVAGGFRLREPAPGEDRVLHRRLRRDRARGARGRRAARRRGGRRGDRARASPRPTGSTATGRRAAPPAARRRRTHRRTSSGSSPRTSAACPSSP